MWPSRWTRWSPSRRPRPPPTSRYVVPDADGEPTGYLHLKDVLDLEETGFELPVPGKRIRRLVTVFSGSDLEDALATMRR